MVSLNWFEYMDVPQTWRHKYKEVFVAPGQELFPVCDNMGELYRNCDLDTVVNFLAKQVHFDNNFGIQY